jgi:hypothetical protein
VLVPPPAALGPLAPVVAPPNNEEAKDAPGLSSGDLLTIVVGTVTLAGAVAILGTHLAMSPPNTSRWLDFVPVAGPVAQAAQYGQSPSWQGALTFAAWAEAAGAIMLIAAGQHIRAMREGPVQVSGGAGNGSAELGLVGRF